MTFIGMTFIGMTFIRMTFNRMTFIRMTLFMIEQVALVKSSLVLKMQMKTQTFPLFTRIMKTEIIYKSYKNATVDGLGERT
jgi:hypothetical protein